MEGKPDGEERRKEFTEAAFICVECNEDISLENDNFMPPCCASRVTCHRCHNRGRVRKCNQCDRNVVFIRVRAEFFGGIRAEIERQKVREREKVLREHQALVRRRQKQRAGGNDAQDVKMGLNKLLSEHIHAKNCQLYLNLDYVCETVVKIARTNDPGVVITINDILAYQCLHCGHGGREELGNQYGGNKRRAHTMFDCRGKCCGRFMDRRILQYEGGQCECGVLLMEYLGIKPATDKQHEWRRALYVGDYSRKEVEDVHKNLAPTIIGMGLSKTHMISWYVASRGVGYLGYIQGKSREDREATLWGIVREINEEYSAHRPVQ